MQELTVAVSEAGRRFDRYLMKLLPKASRGFIFKSLRGNGFRVNGKRMRDPEYVIQAGDLVALYLTDEQLREFGFESIKEVPKMRPMPVMPQVPVVYEDTNLVIFNKPAGLLSQKNREDSISLTEIGMEYLYSKGLERTAGFKPGVCNRLDQNTSGAVIMAKNLETAQAVSLLIRDRRIGKYYYAIVEGCAQWKGLRECVHYYKKDEKANRMHLYEDPVSDQQVRCRVSVEAVNQEQQISLLKIELITGKSHQIRSQLAKIGYPIIGDPKYRAEKEYHKDKKRFSVSHQMLCAVELHFADTVSPLEYLKGKHIHAELPKDMDTIVTHYFTMR